VKDFVVFRKGGAFEISRFYFRLFDFYDKLESYGKY